MLKAFVVQIAAGIAGGGSHRWTQVHSCLGVFRFSASQPFGDCHVIFDGQSGESFEFDPSDGEVYFDGSCTMSEDAEASRASCAAVQIRDSGEQIKSLCGNVPAALHQTPKMAEHCAIASVYMLSSGGVHAKGDCMSTIIAAARGPAWAEGHAPMRLSGVRFF